MALGKSLIRIESRWWKAPRSSPLYPTPLDQKKLMVTLKNLDEWKSKWQIHAALSVEFHEERKTLKEGERWNYKMRKCFLKQANAKIQCDELLKCGEDEFNELVAFYVNGWQDDHSTDIGSHSNDESIVM